MIINYRRIILRKNESISYHENHFSEGTNCCWWAWVLFRHRCSPFNILGPMCYNISWWLSHFCRLHNLWPLHLIEKGSKLIGKVHTSLSIRFSWSRPENCRFLRHKSDDTFYRDERASHHFVIISISQTWKITQH